MDIQRAQVVSLVDRMGANNHEMKRIRDTLTNLRSLYESGELVSYRDINKEENRSRILLKKNREIAATIAAISHKIEDRENEMEDLVDAIRYRADHASDTILFSLSKTNPLQFDITFRNSGTENWDDTFFAEVLVENPVTEFMDLETVFVPAGVTVAPRQTHTFSFDFGIIDTIGNYQVQAYMVSPEHFLEPIFRKNIFITN